MREENLMKILLAPHVSEKSTMLASLEQQYVFKVCKTATKPEIKRAVELMFNVKVADVRVTNVKQRTKRFGQIEGKRSGWKKAYVSLQSGHKIDFGGAQA